jgi:hypothetical protein
MVDPTEIVDEEPRVRRRRDRILFPLLAERRRRRARNRVLEQAEPSVVRGRRPRRNVRRPRASDETAEVEEPTRRVRRNRGGVGARIRRAGRRLRRRAANAVRGRRSTRRT